MISRDFDELKFDAASRTWIFESRPHVRMYLRRMFQHAKAGQGDVITIKHSEKAAQDIHWFLMRYPHVMQAGTRQLLAGTVAAAEARHEEAGAILRGQSSGLNLDLAIPARDYQRAAIELVENQGGLLCGDDLGLGKTIVGIGLASLPQARPMVVVCPTHLQTQWKKQFGKFAPMLSVKVAKTSRPEKIDTDVLIMTYHKAAGWAGVINPRSVVFDECQELRHNTSAKYQACQTLASGCDYRLGLSATPVYNYGGEIYNIMEILRPGALGAPEEFCKDWCSSFSAGKWIVDDPAALGSYLRAEKLMLRRVRKDVGRELPPVQHFAEQVPYDAEVMKALTADALQLAKQILHGTFNEKGQASRLLDLKLRQATGISKAPMVAAFVADMVKAGKKVILGGWHREVYQIWQAHFAQEEIRSWLYTGSESDAQKNRNASEFIAHEGGAVFILSNRSGAGLDGLQTVADVVVFGELDWSPQVHEQFVGRLQRDGQFNAAGVTVFYLVSDAGSDPIIASILGVKMEQGGGITDPELDMSARPIAQKLSKADEIQQETNRMVKLAREFIARHNRAA